MTPIALKILSVNLSEKKGTAKKPVSSITLSANGIEGDAHSGPWHRQLSLLGVESIQRFEKEAGRKIQYGEFAENITTEGMELWKCKPLDRFVGEGFDLEVTQIGKKCHGDSCAIFREVGNCVMPKEGIFARVISPGTRDKDSTTKGEATAVKNTQRGLQEPETWSLKPGATLSYLPKRFTARIITLSDRAFRGEYADKSGPRIAEHLKAFIPALNQRADDPCPVTLLPDDTERLLNAFREAVALETDFIFTTGGTGIGPRDITVDAIKPLLDKEIPGIMEMIRITYGTLNPQALLSRSLAGIAGKSLVFCLPGSVKAVDEYMEEILKSLWHMVYMLHDVDAHKPLAIGH